MPPLETIHLLSYQYAEKFYGLTEEGGDKDEDEDLDIEAAIKMETAALTEDKQSSRLFSAVRIDIECVMFFRVQPSIDPVDLCHRIALDIFSNPDKKLTRYVNRISPMTLMGKANEKGLEEVTKAVLKPHFQLNGQEESTESEQEDKIPERPSYTVSYSLVPN
jgi:tRNA acetyltransferase TAN1